MAKVLPLPLKREAQRLLKAVGASRLEPGSGPLKLSLCYSHRDVFIDLHLILYQLPL